MTEHVKKFKNGIYRNTLKVKVDRADPRDQLFKYSYNIDRSKWKILVDPRKEMPPVLDQSTLGSCVSNSISNHVRHVHKLDWQPSRLFEYYNCRAQDGTIESDAGTEVRTGVKSASIWGLCPETDWTYDITKFAEKPSKNCYDDAKKEIVHKYYRLQDVDDLKQNLSDGFVASAGLSLYESFESEDVAKTGFAPLYTSIKNDTPIGGHCILICGYGKASDFLSKEAIAFWKIPSDLSVFLVQNSWGTDWGLDGYFVIQEEWIKDPNIGSDFWCVRPN